MTIWPEEIEIPAVNGTVLIKPLPLLTACIGGGGACDIRAHA